MVTEATGAGRKPDACRHFSDRLLNALPALLLVLWFVPVPLLAQTPVTTWHYDNARDSANTSETLLTPANVNFHGFGKLFTQAVDGLVVGQPLYLPGVSIAGEGVHNVVYVVTMHDSVYAFDADNANMPPLWQTSIFTYSPAGATTVSATVKRGAGTTGWTEVGIVPTPVIDSDPGTGTGTLYLVAETYENGNVVHRLHALDVTSGQEVLGGPTTIAATYTLNGTTTTFKDLYQLNRPGLLLANGHIYLGFGSNCCNDPSQGWLLSYNASTLQQEGAITVEPGRSLASIWQKGAGLTADSDGNIYAETGEGYYLPGVNLSTSVFKLNQVGTTLELADWFTPINHAYLSANDLDLDQAVVILPDQPGTFPHEAIAIGKEGTVYLLNRDNMGQLCTTCTTMDTQIVQELLKTVGSESGTPVYWNNTVYFTGQSSPVMAFTLNNGTLVTPPAAESTPMGGGGHGLITANGTSNGVLWFINGGWTLYALDAVSLKVIYTSNQAAGGRDTLPGLAHFATPIAADGRVFVGTKNSLVVYGLFPALAVTSGSGQSGTVASTLPTSLTVQAIDPYTKNVFPGLTITFSDGGKGGSFNPASAVTDQTGSASTAYTLPTRAGSYTLTASTPNYPPGLFTETAVHGPATGLFRRSGGWQTGTVATTLPIALSTVAKDKYGNTVPGVVVHYTDTGAGGSFSANPVTTDSNGLAPSSYTTPTTAGILHKIYATASGLNNLNYPETAVAGPATTIAPNSGNGQNASPNTQLPQALVAKVTDQYGNPVSGNSVTFSDGGAGGTFSANPVTTSSTGLASVSYTTSGNVGTVTIQAAATGVSATASFTITVQ
jgi:hypothetical protein